MKKRAFALLLSAILCFTLTSTAFAAKIVVEDGNTKVVDDDYESSKPEPPKPENPKPDPKPTPSDRDNDDDDDDGYSVNVPSRTPGGKVRVTPNSADKGDTVTITVTPDAGYELGTLTVTDARGNAVEVRNQGGGKYTFVMPGSRVSVNVTFVRSALVPAPSAFSDVPAGAYYAEAVAWAVEKGITAGTTASTFSPNAPCTRAQIVTFLWRASGSPRVGGSNPFSDVAAGSYYYDAVLWAVEKGITGGTTATAFSPNNACTRGQAVTFLYRAEGSPAVTGASAFSDVADGAYYTSAVAWAVEKGVTAGTTATTFTPNSTCTRAQIVTFLYRDMA